MSLPPLDTASPPPSLPPLDNDAGDGSTSLSVASSPPSVVAVPPPTVQPAYVLYTDTNVPDTPVPRDGYVTVQSFGLVRATIAAAMLPDYLKAKGKPLPVLVTLNEEKPTVWFGMAARDQCRLLCILHGGDLI